MGYYYGMSGKIAFVPNNTVCKEKEYFCEECIDSPATVLNVCTRIIYLVLERLLILVLMLAIFIIVKLLSDFSQSDRDIFTWSEFYIFTVPITIFPILLMTLCNIRCWSCCSRDFKGNKSDNLLLPDDNPQDMSINTSYGAASYY